MDVKGIFSLKISVSVDSAISATIGNSELSAVSTLLPWFKLLPSSFKPRKKELRIVSFANVLWKKVFLKISQNSHKNTSVGVSFLTKLQNSGDF